MNDQHFSNLKAGFPLKNLSDGQPVAGKVDEDSGLLSPELAARIRRVKGVKQLGSRIGNWLTRDQAKMLLEKADGKTCAAFVTLQ